MNISSTTLIGLAGDAYRTGIAVSNYEWMAGVVLVFIAVITFGQFDFSWAQATAQLPEDHLSLIRPMGSEGLP